MYSEGDNVTLTILCNVLLMERNGTLKVLFYYMVYLSIPNPIYSL